MLVSMILPTIFFFITRNDDDLGDGDGMMKPWHTAIIIRVAAKSHILIVNEVMPVYIYKSGRIEWWELDEARR